MAEKEMMDGEEKSDLRFGSRKARESSLTQQRSWTVARHSVSLLKKRYYFMIQMYLELFFIFKFQNLRSEVIIRRC
ncbi:MAG: hypothetical protein IKA06_01685 [Clostridia bacterium]|nr:hypothetical protein [Clostridia bacterium]